MSELKGQILGIFIVLAIFAAIIGPLKTVFTNLTSEVANEVTEVVNNNS